jgi:hypothetical protein
MAPSERRQRERPVMRRLWVRYRAWRARRLERRVVRYMAHAIIAELRRDLIADLERGVRFPPGTSARYVMRYFRARRPAITRAGRQAVHDAKEVDALLASLKP